MKLSMIQHYKGATEFLFKQNPKAIFKALWLPLILTSVCMFLKEFILLNALLGTAAYVVIMRNMIAFMDTGTFSYTIWQWGKRDFSFLLRYSIFLLPVLVIGFLTGIVMAIMGYADLLINPSPLVAKLLGALIVLAVCFLMLPFTCAYHIYCFSAYQTPLKFKEAWRLAKGNNLRFGFISMFYYIVIIVIDMNPSFGGKIISAIMVPLLTLHVITSCVSVFMSLVKGKGYYEK
ncbi:MAG: hypothetical protein FJX18_06640 [Alphaproteobacteria bacterium]|nr:hypothetical protein [Alphaproteobacteria bacterium]